MKVKVKWDSENSSGASTVVSEQSKRLCWYLAIFPILKIGASTTHADSHLASGGETISPNGHHQNTNQVAATNPLCSLTLLHTSTISFYGIDSPFKDRAESRVISHAVTRWRGITDPNTSGDWAIAKSIKPRVIPKAPVHP